MKIFITGKDKVYKKITTILDKNIGTTTKNGVVLEATSNVKLFLETILLS